MAVVVGASTVGSPFFQLAIVIVVGISHYPQRRGQIDNPILVSDSLDRGGIVHESMHVDEYTA